LFVTIPQGSRGHNKCNTTKPCILDVLVVKVWFHYNPAVPRRGDHDLLHRLLAERADHPRRAPEIDALIKQRFEKTVAILVLDMCGFSRLTARHGVISYLAMIRQMHACAIPAVRDNGGRTIKTVADDLFAVFPTPQDAVEAALDIHRAFAAVNEAVPCDQDIHGSIGIGYGPTLLLDDADLFGHQVNLASKLGEDLACGDEILLTPAAAEVLPASAYEIEPVEYRLHDEVFAAFRLRRALV
jgi:adenylate cyclase